jgi:hypothetical protein
MASNERMTPEHSSAKKHESRLHLIAVIWWLNFWESVVMGKIPATKEAENRRVFWKMDRNKGEFIIERFGFSQLCKRVIQCSRT